MLDAIKQTLTDGATDAIAVSGLVLAAVVAIFALRRIVGYAIFGR